MPVFSARSPLSSLAAALLVVLAVLLPAPVAQAASCPAGPMIISAGRTYDAAARAGSAAAFASGVDRYSDMRAIALFALGRYRKLLPPSREAEYVALTKSFMGGFMLEHGADLRVGTLEIVSCTGPASDTLVTARTSSGDGITFKVYRAGSGWMIRDMKVSGIWLVQQMRSTFVGTITQSGGDIDGLFKYLKS